MVKTKRCTRGFLSDLGAEDEVSDALDKTQVFELVMGLFLELFLSTDRTRLLALSSLVEKG